MTSVLYIFLIWLKRGEFILWWVSSTNPLAYFSVQLHLKKFWSYLQLMFKNDFKMLTQLVSEIELVKSEKVYIYETPLCAWTYFCLTTEIQTLILLIFQPMQSCAAVEIAGAVLMNHEQLVLIYNFYCLMHFLCTQVGFKLYYVLSCNSSQLQTYLHSQKEIDHHHTISD